MGTTNIKLIASTCTVNLLAFATGNAYSWASTVLVSLKTDDPDKNPIGRPITSTEESWIASLISLGAACGPFVAGLFSQKYGRKKTLLMFTIPMLISHAILAFATTPLEFFIARFLVGLGAGCVFTVVPMYVGEIAETEIRGLLGCVMGVFISLGLLFVYIIGPYVNLTTLSFILMTPIILCIFLFGFFVPESPYFYVTVGDDSAAEISLNKLRKSSINQKELKIIKETVDESSGGSLSLCSLLKCRSFRKGITITTTLMIFQQFVGITAILSYMQSIFMASGSTISSSASTVIVASIQTITVLICSYLADVWGRKMLLIIASAGSALPLFTLGLYFHLKNTGSDVSSLWWLPIASLVVYIISYNFGLGTLPWALVGELFTSKTKSLASTATAFTCLFLAFIMTFIFPTLERLLGFQGVFWFFSASAIVSLLFVLWYVPETKGKSFQEILRILER